MLPPDYTGKVRNVYNLGEKLLLVSTDRISAFDCVFAEPVPEKGKILNRISNRWFQAFPEIENHLLETNWTEFPGPFRSAEFEDRAVLVRNCKRIDFECVVRGYISGSLYKEYKKFGTIGFLPTGKDYLESERLENSLFTPAIKNDIGHDENISEEEMRNRVGVELFSILKSKSIYLYETARKKLESVGIILCDTKFEFGFYENRVILIDELLTPDSSRYWDAGEYEVGISPPSFDKQILRNYLESTGWNKEPPVPALPNDIIDKIRNKYKEIEQKINLCILEK